MKPDNSELWIGTCDFCGEEVVITTLEGDADYTCKSCGKGNTWRLPDVG